MPSAVSRAWQVESTRLTYLLVSPLAEADAVFMEVNAPKCSEIVGDKVPYQDLSTRSEVIKSINATAMRGACCRESTRDTRY